MQVSGCKGGAKGIRKVPKKRINKKNQKKTKIGTLLQPHRVISSSISGFY
jgi:hypothetical protein